MIPRVARPLAGVAAMTLIASSARGQTPIPEPVSVDTGYVTYEPGTVSLPLGVGFRIPSYDRVDGLSLRWGPVISIGKGRLRIDPTVTYRSHLGKVDPALRIVVSSSGGFGVELNGARGTFTNDGWIRSDVVNSAAAFGVGSDARNYFRADRANLELSQSIANDSAHFRFAGIAQTENGWSTGSRDSASGTPWSVFGRTDELRMRRPNPAVWQGHITSGFGRFNVSYARDQVTAALDALVERAFDVRVDEPLFPAGPQVLDAPPPPTRIRHTENFTQITIGSKATFPTFGTQSFTFRGRFVGSAGSAPPPQRYVFLGGGGTLATVDLLALGGDRLLYVEGEYAVPIDRLVLPFVGSPSLVARYAAGSAGVGELPDLIQNLSAGVSLRLLKIQYHFDPNYRKTAFTKEHAVTVGVSLPAF